MRVGLCGALGSGKTVLNGQVIKTKILLEELGYILGEESIKSVDTYRWKKRPISLLIKTFYLLKNSDNIIILPAQNGIKVFVPLFLFFNIFFNRKIHYVVIGGWLPQMLDNKIKLRRKIGKLTGVYVETYSMMKMLEEQGLSNIKYFPNFKRLNIVEEKKLQYTINKPFKLCTFSRVSKEKGIEDAINAVKYINESFGYEVYSLDIYGQVDVPYIEKFKQLQETFPQYISYKGHVDYRNTVSILKEYFALLFPTYYEGEGFAGTILDAYAAGLPVIATDWKYNSEIIENELDGILYDYRDANQLNNILDKISRNPDIILRMKQNCLKRARQYAPEKVIGEFVENLKI